MYQTLVVDDREIFRRQIKRIPMLRDGGEFCVKFEAQNGTEALAILEHNKIDLVITDIKMPVMDGLELLREIKERDICRCVILLSEYTNFSYAKQGLVLGAFDFIEKPIEPGSLEELLPRVKCFLDRATPESLYTDNELTMLAALILKNDGYAEKVAAQIYSRIKMARGGNPVEIAMALERIFGEIRKRIEKERKWLSYYVDMDQTFSFDRLGSAERMDAEFSARTERLIFEVNKLTVNSRNRLILDVADYILTNVENGDLSLKSVALEFYTNKTYLSHIFKIETGISFINYVTVVKMERAKMLFKNDLKVYELAERLGYSDPEYFGKLFKKYTGISANCYKKTAEP